MKAIVIGGTGTIGSAVVELLRQKGYDVEAVSRSTQPAIDITSTESIRKYFENTAAADVVVVAAGDGSMAKLGAITPDQLDLAVRGKLWGQIQVVSSGVKKLNPGGVFVLTGGILAYSPMPGTSLMATTNAGVEGFVKSASLEMTEGRRILVVHPDWVRETAIKAGMDGAKYPDATETAKAYWKAIQSEKTGKAVFLDGREPKGK